MSDLDRLAEMVSTMSGGPFEETAGATLLAVAPELIAVARAVQDPTVGIIDNLCNGLGCGECLLCLNAALDAALSRVLGREET